MRRHLQHRVMEWNFPPAAFVAEIIATTGQSRAVLRRFENVEPKVPDPMELDGLVREVQDEWRRKASLHSLPGRTKRKLPWLLFYPGSNPEGWLAADAALGNAAFECMAAQRRPAAVASLVRVLLSKYPREWRYFEIWIQRMEALVHNCHSVRLTRWRTRQAQFGVLHTRAPENLARIWLSWDATKEEFLEATGLDDTGADSGIRTAVNQEVLRQLSALLSTSHISADKLASRIKLLTTNNGKITTDYLKPIAAHLLLSPFREHSPAKDIENVISSFFLECIGDPRIKPGSWNTIQLDDRKVLLRWLVGVALAEFFRLLDRTAMDRHWQQRKEFWQAYLQMDVITDAWLALGPDARELARSSFGAAGGTWGVLGRGGDRSQSVLIMKLSGLTIAEWSHNGSCRIWPEGAPSAPKLYEKSYRRKELASPTAEAQVRHDVSGNWKRTIGDFIRRQTGIEVGAR
jgi:hypothetical protein